MIQAALIFSIRRHLAIHVSSRFINILFNCFFFDLKALFLFFFKFEVFLRIVGSDLNNNLDQEI